MGICLTLVSCHHLTHVSHISKTANTQRQHLNVFPPCENTNPGPVTEYKVFWLWAFSFI